MIITKTWAMPNSKTFSIKPINSIIERYIGLLEMEREACIPEMEREACLPLCIVDPFARERASLELFVMTLTLSTTLSTILTQQSS